MVHTFIYGVLDRQHRCLGLGIIVRHKVIEDAQHRTLTEDLRTAQTCLGTKHLHAQTMTLCVGELHVVVSEGGIRNPLLQELAVVVAELDVLTCRLHTVVHRVGHIDHSFDLAQARKESIHGHEQNEILHE